MSLIKASRLLWLLVCLLCILSFVSCSMGENDTSMEIDNNKDNLETHVNIKDYIISNNESDYTKSNVYDEQYILTDILMYKITKNYILTTSYEFTEGDLVPFNEGFKYFMYDGCYSFDETRIATNMIEFYDPDKMEFSVPVNIADEYIINHFNTDIDHSMIEFYDQKSDTYIFPRHLGEFYYDMKVISKNQLENNVYSFAVELTSNINSEFDSFKCSFIIKLDDSGYMIKSFDRL